VIVPTGLNVREEEWLQTSLVAGSTDREEIVASALVTGKWITCIESIHNDGMFVA
jgi:hypothetical protein